MHVLYVDLFNFRETKYTNINILLNLVQTDISDVFEINRINNAVGKRTDIAS